MAGDGYDLKADGSGDGGWEHVATRIGENPPSHGDGWCEVEFRKVCNHEDFHIHGDFAYLEDIEQFMLDLNIKCKQCDTPFHFIGFEFGCLLNRPAMSVDGTELRLPIAPGKLKIEASGTLKFGVM